MARAYTYRELSGDDSIRLLTIRPGDESEDLHLELEEVKIRDKPQFEAVSYCWGEKDFSATVHLEGDELQLRITPRLALALRYFRYQHQSRRVWVDAICIDQSNEDEKSQQVSLMSQVYSIAKQVLIWLGEGNSETHRAVGCLEDFAQRADDLGMDWNPNGINYHPYRSLELGLEEAQGIVERGKEACVFAMPQRAWFRRLWIIQEILLAQDATIVCGTDIISWTHFARALRLFGDAIAAADSSLISDSQENEALQKAITIATTRAQFRMWGAPNAMVVEPWSNSFILGIYDSFCNQQCYDDRDRVFGFLALHGSQHKLDFAPNYRWTVEETYKEFALSLLRVEHGCRHLLDHAGIWDREDDESTNHDTSNPNYLPSWASDFRPTNTTSRLPITLRSRGFQTASNFDGMTDSSRTDENILRFRGKIFDDLLVLIECPPDFVATATLTEQLLGHYASLELESYPTGENAINAFLRTMVMGDKTIEMERLRELWEGFRKVVFGKVDAKEHDEVTLQTWLQLHNGIVAHVNHDACVVTNRGFFGLVPFATRLSDYIAIIAGLDTPYVIRWVEELGAYLLVGACYIHGLMESDDENPADHVQGERSALARTLIPETIQGGLHASCVADSRPND